MKDAALSLGATNWGAASATVYTQTLDMAMLGQGATNLASGASNAWRLGKFRISVPAMAAHVTTTKYQKIDLQSAASTSGAETTPSTFANTNPLVECSVVGVTSTGSKATTFDVPIPPNCGRFIRFALVSDSTSYDLTAFAVTIDWVFE